MQRGDKRGDRTDESLNDREIRCVCVRITVAFSVVRRVIFPREENYVVNPSFLQRHNAGYSIRNRAGSRAYEEQ